MFCRCKNEKPIVIYQGDDTDFIGNPRVYLELETDLDLDGVTAKFEFLGVEKTFDVIPETKLLAVEFTKEETKTFPVGNAFASLKLTDSEGRVRTVSSDIKIFVTDNVDIAYNITDDNIINLSVTKSCSGGGGGGSVEVDNELSQNSPNPVKSSGIWSAIWGSGGSGGYDSVVSFLKGEFREFQDLRYFIEILQYVDTWTFDLKLGGNSFDTVDLTLLSSEDNPSASVRKREIWHGLTKDLRYYTTLELLRGTLETSATLTVAITGVTPAPSVMGSAGISFTTLDLSEDGNPLSATGSLSTKYTNVLVANDSLALAGEIEKELKTKLNKTNVVTPDGSATEGQAADAKATYEALGNRWLVGGSAEQNKAVGAKLGGLEIDASGELDGTGSIDIYDGSGVSVTASSSGFSISGDSEDFSHYASMGVGAFNNGIVTVENGVKTEKYATYRNDSIDYFEAVDEDISSEISATLPDIINTANGRIGLEAMFTAHPIEYVGSGEDGYTPPASLPKARLMEAHARYTDVGNGEFDGSKEIELYAPLVRYYYGDERYSSFVLGGYGNVYGGESELFDNMECGSSCIPYIELVEENYVEYDESAYLIIEPIGIHNTSSFSCGRFHIESRTPYGIQFAGGFASGLESESFDGPTYAHLTEGGLLSQVYLGYDDDSGDFTIERTLCVGLGATDYGQDMNNLSRVFRVENRDMVKADIVSSLEITCPVSGPEIYLFGGDEGSLRLKTNQLSLYNDKNRASISLGAGDSTEDPGVILDVDLIYEGKHATLTVNKIKDIGEEMPSAPTQNELIECVKKLWTKFGGTIAKA